MGSQSSKDETTTEKPYCPDCEKSQQKDLPNQDAISSEGQPCQESYVIVDKCMKQNNGQISSCVKEWTEFQQCHATYKK